MPYADPKKNDEAKRRYRESARGKAKEREWYLAHREEVIARSAAWQRANPEARRAGSRRAYWENLEEQRARSREKSRKARRADPYKHCTSLHKYRSRREGNASPGVASAEWAALLEQYGHCCAYCLKPGRLERDHVTPISRGGLDEISNVVPSCHACNTRKRDRTLLEWTLIGGAVGAWVKSRRKRARLLGKAAP